MVNTLIGSVESTKGARHANSDLLEGMNRPGYSGDFLVLSQATMTDSVAFPALITTSPPECAGGSKQLRSMVVECRAG